jgi:hypothetical protein
VKCPQKSFQCHSADGYFHYYVTSSHKNGKINTIARVITNAARPQPILYVTQIPSQSFEERGITMRKTVHKSILSTMILLLSITLLIPANTFAAAPSTWAAPYVSAVTSEPELDISRL